jgi:hypothetical protein
MIKPKHELKILRHWALDELKLVSQRAFEFAKFFFAASIASFGIIPFFDSSVSLGNIFQFVGMLLLALSAFWAIRMLEPPTFEISENTILSEEHAKYANRIKRLRELWLICWVLGVVFLVIGLTTGVEVRFVFSRG